MVATLAAAGVARPAYVWARNRVDRRFNRRRFDAVRMVEAGLAEPSPDVEALLREALGDPEATLVFAADRGWVTADGRVAEAGNRAVDIRRRGTVTARLRYDPSRTEAGVVAAVAAAAAAEIDNLGLRATRWAGRGGDESCPAATAHLTNGGGWSATCTTAPSNGCSPWPPAPSARFHHDDAVVRRGRPGRRGAGRDRPGPRALPTGSSRPPSPVAGCGS